MKIYAIRRDGFKYQELDLNVNDFIDDFPEDVSYIEAHEFSFNNMAMSGFWKLMKAGFSKIEGHENLIPDITPWIGATLLFSPKAHRLLGETLKPFGEFLPIVLEEETYQIFNCLTLAEVIEEKISDSHLEFDTDSVGQSLVFKSKFQRCIDTFCTERLKALVEEFELSGVVFDEHLGTFERDEDLRDK